jgi:hypothetical protein
MGLEIIRGAYLPQTRYQCYRFTQVLGGYQERGENRIEFQVNSFLSCTKLNSKDKGSDDDVGCLSLTKNNNNNNNF